MMDVPPATEGWLRRNALTFAADLPDTHGKPEHYAEKACPD